MRKILAIACFFTYHSSFAQLRMTANPQATGFYNKAIVTARPAVQAAVNKTAAQLAGKNISENDLRARIKTEPAFAGMSSADIDGLMILVLMQLNNDAEKDVRDQMAALKKNSESKKKQRELAATKDSLHTAAAIQMQKTNGGNKDAIADMSETDQLRLQQAMDKRSRLEAMISNLMKAIGDNQSQIIANLK